MPGSGNLVAEATVQLAAVARGLAVVTLFASQMCWKSLPAFAATCPSQGLGDTRHHQVPFAHLP